MSMGPNRAIEDRGLDRAAPPGIARTEGIDTPLYGSQKWIDKKNSGLERPLKDKIDIHTVQYTRFMSYSLYIEL